jgi:hypothetical protein
MQNVRIGNQREKASLACSSLVRTNFQRRRKGSSVFAHRLQRIEWAVACRFSYPTVIPYGNVVDYRWTSICCPSNACYRLSLSLERGRERESRTCKDGRKDSEKQRHVEAERENCRCTSCRHGFSLSRVPDSALPKRWLINPKRSSSN